MAPGSLDVVVGLGSNLGDRVASLRGAVSALAARFPLRARSGVYETAPVGPPQPDYLNAAIRLSVDVSPTELLRFLLDVERAGGRVREERHRWGARTVDLDILWIAGLVLSTEPLTVPHARLHERAFALRPLLDVAPDAVDPRTGLPFTLPAEHGDVRRTALVL